MSGTFCSVPKCSRLATVLIEWGHGHGEKGKPFRDWLCKGCAAALLEHDGPRRIEEAHSGDLHAVQGAPDQT